MRHAFKLGLVIAALLLANLFLGLTKQNLASCRDWERVAHVLSHYDPRIQLDDIPSC